MSAKKTLKEVEPEEVVKSFVLPVKRSSKKQKDAQNLLSDARLKLRKEATPREILAGKLLQFKFRLEEYINSKKYEPNMKFGHFLKSYLSLLNMKSNEFAHDISIHKTLISQLINNTREPNESIIVRLELHSNNTIPANYWFQLIVKEKVNSLAKNKELRKKEKKFVVRKLHASI